MRYNSYTILKNREKVPKEVPGFSRATQRRFGFTPSAWELQVSVDMTSVIRFLSHSVIELAEQERTFAPQK